MVCGQLDPSIASGHTAVQIHPAMRLEILEVTLFRWGSQRKRLIFDVQQCRRPTLNSNKISFTGASLITTDAAQLAAGV